MARPRSEDKRNAILAAAVEVIAQQGTSAPTARIAKLANVAEGTLFTYFATKDDLLNALYLDLKTELGEAMTVDYPEAGSLKDRCRHTWTEYVTWGVAQPKKRKAMAQLKVSERITENCKMTTVPGLTAIHEMLMQSIAQGVLRDQPSAFAIAILSALAETTMEFIARQPEQAEQTAAAGFEAFWRAIASD